MYRIGEINVARLIFKDLSYSEGIGGDSQTRLMLSELLNHYFKPALPTEPSHFVLAAGGSFALSALVEQILDPGDGVLVATPYWPGLDICFNVHNNVEAIPVHIPLEAYFEAASIRYYEEALQNASVPVKGVLVCNPHNPLGRCYPKESLKTLMAFCKKNGLHYISNEVYGLSQHGDVDGESAFPQFVSVLGLEPQSESVHVIYSLSKDFGCNGIRLVSAEVS
jgi:aspartate/methionine/tyrosine aminotransferase